MIKPYENIETLTKADIDDTANWLKRQILEWETWQRSTVDGQMRLTADRELGILRRRLLYFTVPSEDMK